MWRSFFAILEENRMQNSLAFKKDRFLNLSPFSLQGGCMVFECSALCWVEQHGLRSAKYRFRLNASTKTSLPDVTHSHPPWSPRAKSEKKMEKSTLK
mmetsp:Transcript_30206/g.63178  ORF Transcript_30206/g.63178 Transcript_30206/m.63178 type:complete len:97 (+) Transcript_30206:2318-2608(+)